jgi:hypothetical protein
MSNLLSNFSRIQSSNQQNQNNLLINTTFDPTKQYTHPYKNNIQHTSITYSPPINTSNKQILKNIISSSGNVNDTRLDNLRPQGLPTHPTMVQSTQTDRINSILIEKISEKIYNHFKQKYPNTIDASGFSKQTIESIVGQSMKKQILDEKAISKIIDIIDHKFKTTIHSDNRQGTQYDTTAFSMDVESKISIDKYLENYTNKVAILLDSDKTVEAELPKNMAPANDMVKLEKPEPFNEDFPIRDREKQTDMMHTELREYDYYVVINSNDRNTNTFSDPNNFIIDFAPAHASQGSDPRKGYIERNFNNIKSCELMNVIIRDTSDLIDSSDANGKSFPYLLLQFDELQRNYYGTNDYLSKAFAILTDYSTVGKYKYYRMVGDSSENTVSRIYNPRINLNKITTRLLLPDGTPFNFGSVNNNDTSNACISFGLRIITLQKNLSTQFINNA